jgi:hypothetical protein
MNELLPRHFDYHILTLTSFRSTTFDGTPSPKSSIIYEAYTTSAIPSFRILKMLDPAIHMPAGVNRVSWNNLQTDGVLHSDSSSHWVSF